MFLVQKIICKIQNQIKEIKLFLFYQFQLFLTKSRYIFLNSLYQLYFNMDDFNQNEKYDLCQTQFSLSNQLSSCLLQKPYISIANNQSQNIAQQQQNIKPQIQAQENVSPFIKQQTEQQIEQQQQHDYMEQFHNPKIQTKTSSTSNFLKNYYTKRDVLLNCQISQSNLRAENKTTKFTNQDQQQGQIPSQSQSSEQVFSQKISFIRQLQKKLQNLHQRLRGPTLNYQSSQNIQFDELKNNLQKECQMYSQSVVNQVDTFDKLYQTSLIRSQNLQYTNKIKDFSIQSQQLLLDNEFLAYDKDMKQKRQQINTNHAQKQNPQLHAQNNHSQMKNINQIQYVQTIRIIQIPYLIEIDREIEQDKIQSKKSFYFEENQEIHKTFQDFVQKERVDQDKIGNNTNRDQGLSQQHHEQDNSQNNSQIPLHSLMLQKSLLSLNQSSNKTFHQQIKQKYNQISYNMEQNSRIIPENNQILSKLLTKYNQSQIIQLQDKLKVLQIENLQLRDKIVQLKGIIENLEEQNTDLWQQWKNLEQERLKKQQRIKQYKQTILKLNEQFGQSLYEQQSVIKKNYEQQIDQYQNQQSQYANRIIMFEQLFQQNKLKQVKMIQQLQKKAQQICQLKKIIQQKENDVETEKQWRENVQQELLSREKQLKNVIQNLQKDNLQLKNTIKQFQHRCEEQGFYILKEQAEQLKKTIQEKDLGHVEQLDRLENQYQTLIAKYQKQIQFMKKGLEKVRLNKSTSISVSLKQSKESLISYNNNIDASKFNSITSQQSSNKKFGGNFFKTLQSIRTTRVSNSHSNTSLQFQNSQTQTHRQQKPLNFLQLKHTQSIENSQQVQSQFIKLSDDSYIVSFDQQNSSISILNEQGSLISNQQHQKQKQLLSYEIQNLKMQNHMIKNTLNKQRQLKQKLSSQLVNINYFISKYMQRAEQMSQESQKNEQVFQKCVEQLEKQYKINQKLKSKLKLIEQSTVQNITQVKESPQIPVQLLKKHPFYIQLNRKYKKSQQYIKLLEKQLKELASFPEFDEENNKCCKEKSNTINQLKNLLNITLS